MFFIIFLVQFLQFSDNSKSINSISLNNKLNLEHHFYNAPEIKFQYINRKYSIASLLRLNDVNTFEIEVNPLSVMAERASDIEKLKTLKFDPNIYERSINYELEFAYKFSESLVYSLSSKAVKERFLNTEPKYVISSTNELIPFTELSEFTRHSIYFNNILYYNNKGLRIGFGFKDIGIKERSRNDIFTTSDPSYFFSFGLDKKFGGIDLSSSTSLRSIRGYYNFVNLIQDKNTTFHFGFDLSNVIDMQMYSASLNIDMSEKFSLHIGYSNTFINNTITTKKEFNQWKEIALDFPKIKNHAFEIGLTYNFNEYEDVHFVRIIKSEIFTNEYLSSEHYKSNEKCIGKIQFKNVNNKTIVGQLVLESGDKKILYISDQITLLPRAEVELPIIIRSEIEIKENVLKHLSVQFRFNDLSLNLMSIPVMFYRKSVWNGNINSLTSYIDITDKKLLKKIGIIQYQITKKKITNPYKKLRETIEWFSKFGVLYKQDNVSSHEYDEVQSISNTIESGFGDCEDLVVLYTSYLLALGIETTFIDFPKRLQENHVFILVNTGLLPSEMIDNHLNELNTIVRMDRFGAPRLWIALEVNEIQNGFSTAHNKGSTQLYREMVLKEKTVDFIETR